MPKGYTDNPNMIGKIRKLSMTINLNQPGEYDGGNLKFDFGPHAQGKRFHECTEIRPQGINHCISIICVSSSNTSNKRNKIFVSLMVIRPTF
jgi:hypothetical protein